MTAKLIEGRKIAEEMYADLEREVSKLEVRAKVKPKLVVMLVGQDPASLSYIKQKQKACAKTGIEWDQFDYDESVTTEELVGKIEELNADPLVHGILVQLPLPKHISVPLVIRAIDPKKDVDGFTAYNLGKMFTSADFEDLAPCTPLGVIKMLEYYDINMKGKEAVVVGHSNIVGKPLSTMLLNRNATVTTCHIDTKDLAFHTKRADILCVGVGKAGLISADMVADGAVVIDIGVNRTDEGKLVGDCDFASVSEKASYITPVPGGAGPMTVACLMLNVVKAAKRLSGYKE
ncbi:bifunctional 5,10-methylenetetrahydrofolate dehydrogenase/5,10-methenyltetrahydrofolate cyclohydrolase [Candidatus Peregrinibacteria bacterium]|nr:bifunctional 5,10-methylenetetrahydrofolate dehydrogenase/5,10-methenyltetrahydrofolate cyclohydrolase [Candidatus Peregrinibacteria bacterium]MBT4055498.1 bifunctional 5,10-methylenetetrahydrofolate dehydrogenase/5,10-methenyltetrahydrofolate cyclohydrolase [Candidatus Peregrinibacteria bacterium]